MYCCSYVPSDPTTNTTAAEQLYSVVVTCRSRRKRTVPQRAPSVANCIAAATACQPCSTCQAHRRCKPRAPRPWTATAAAVVTRLLLYSSTNIMEASPEAPNLFPPTPCVWADATVLLYTLYSSFGLRSSAHHDCCSSPGAPQSAHRPTANHGGTAGVPTSQGDSSPGLYLTRQRSYGTMRNISEVQKQRTAVVDRWTSGS